MAQNRVPLNRALSKLGILSRAEATAAILAGRVRVNGRIARHPTMPIEPETTRIKVDDEPKKGQPWRAVLFHKPRGVLTTRRDPEGRRTVFDVLGSVGDGLITVGRLDAATSGLLLLTTDTDLANWITDPEREVPRVYVVTVRGRFSDDLCARLCEGFVSGGDRLQAVSATVRKASGRESHLTVELREGKNREVRRLFEALGHEVTRLKRVRLGRLELGTLSPGEWRELTADEISSAFDRPA